MFRGVRFLIFDLLELLQFHMIRMVPIIWIRRKTAWDKTVSRPRRAITKRPAESLCLKPAPGKHIRRKVVIGQHQSTQANKICFATSDVVLPNIGQPLLKIAVP